MRERVGTVIEMVGETLTHSGKFTGIKGLVKFGAIGLPFQLLGLIDYLGVDEHILAETLGDDWAHVTNDEIYGFGEYLGSGAEELTSNPFAGELVSDAYFPVGYIATHLNELPWYWCVGLLGGVYASGWLKIWAGKGIKTLGKKMQHGKR